MPCREYKWKIGRTEVTLRCRIPYHTGDEHCRQELNGAIVMWPKQKAPLNTERK